MEIDELKKALHILACSGGPDSIALFSMLKEEGVSFVCCHVNYHLRADSEYDSSLVAEMCEKHQIPYYRHDAEYTGGNEELWARRERYGFFVRIISAGSVLFCIPACEYTADAFIFVDEQILFLIIDHILIFHLT